MAIDSSLYRMADQVCDGNLAQIISDLRADGLSYGQVAKRLYANHGIDVSGQTVANWCKQAAA